MSKELDNPSPRKVNFLALGVGAGMALGAGLGVAIGNVDFGMALGVLFGATVGGFFNHRG